MSMVLFVVSFVVLFFLSRVLTTTLTFAFYHVTRRHSLAVQLLAICLLPGVIIHELSHWLIASILFVKTGEMEFFPQVQENNVKLGSVQVEKTDPFRRFLIGIAPVLCGLGVIFSVFWFFQPALFPVTITSVFFGYIVFEIGNTMFSSKKDLEGLVGVFVLVILIILLLLFFQVPIVELLISFTAINTVQMTFSHLTVFLLIAIGIDSVVIAVVKGGFFLQRFFTVQNN